MRVHEADAPPLIRVQDFDGNTSFGDSQSSECSLSLEHVADHSSSDELLAASQAHGAQPTIFYAGGEDQSNLKLSGIEVFSPAASQPPSPTISRQRLPFDKGTSTVRD